MAALKLLLDENIGHEAVKALRGRGYDIKSILEESRGAADIAILEQAVTENRIVVTLDKDFGRLIFYGSHRHVGVVFLRLEDESQGTIICVLLSVLENYENKLKERFAVATEWEVRMRE